MCLYNESQYFFYLKPQNESDYKSNYEYMECCSVKKTNSVVLADISAVHQWKL